MRSFGLAAAVLFVCACGGGSSEAPASATPASPGASASVAPASPGAMTSSLRRSAVKETIAQGLGAFLQNVSVDDWPVMREGRFIGFRLKAISPTFRVDLQPGDVVTRVNGMAIEHPEDADAALRSLEKASALRIDYERDGKARSLELPIVDDEGKAAPAKTPR